MKVCKSLHEKLETMAPLYKMSRDELFEMLLYEIPDEAIEQFAEMADPVEIAVDPNLELVASGMAEAFGMTTLGLSVLMNKVIDRAVYVAENKKSMLEQV